MVSISYRNAVHPKPFRYASVPRSVHYKSYRNLDENSKPFYGNIMYDKRVIRGNTWALRRMAQEALQQELADERKKQREKLSSLRESINAKLTPFRLQSPKQVTDAKPAATAVEESAAAVQTPAVLTVPVVVEETTEEVELPQAEALEEQTTAADDPPADDTETANEEENLEIPANEEEAANDLPSPTASEAEAANDLPSPTASEEAAAENIQTEASDKQPDAEQEQAPVATGGGEEVSPRSDAETQIELDDLFDGGELDVVLDAIVNRAMGSAVRELEDEQEVDKLRRNRDELKALTEADQTRIAELEESYLTTRKEKETLEYERAILLSAHRKLSARQTAVEFIHRELVPNALDYLVTKGLLSPPVTPRDDKDLQTETPNVAEVGCATDAPTKGVEVGCATAPVMIMTVPDETTGERADEQVPTDTTDADVDTQQLSEDVGDKVENDIATDFLPWTFLKCESQVQTEILSRMLSDSLICGTGEYKRHVRQKVQTSLSENAL